MHELSVALSILDLAAEEAARHGGARVRGIHLKLGPLSGVVKAALLSAYELAREGSGLEEAQLVIDDVPLLARCPTCQATRAVVSVQQLCCAECGTPTPQLVSGRELEIVALELQ
jgi:hydrogenase nickel incorporation protein HypA/HybF